MKKSICTLFLFVLCIFSCFSIAFLPNSANVAFADGLPANAEMEEKIKEQNAFRIIRQADESGKIALIYVFPVNSGLLEEKGFSEGEILTYRFYLSTYVNALAKQNRAKAVEGTTVSNCTYFSDVDGIGFSIVFDDLNAQKRFFGVEENAGGQEKEENEGKLKSSGFYIKKVEMKSTFPVSSTKAAEDLKLICSMAISSWATDNNISAEKKSAVLADLENSVFIYDFATTQTSLKSDLMYDDENFHHNVFIKTLADLEENNQIIFFTTYPNTPVWYATALVIVISGMCVAYVVLSRKKKQTNIAK